MDPPSDPSPEERKRILNAAFRDLAASTPPPPPSASDASDGFVKWADTPRIHMMSVVSRLKSLALSEWGLIEQFSGIWPSPKTMDFWVKKN